MKRRSKIRPRRSWMFRTNSFPLFAPMQDEPTAATPRWLLLIHQLPPKPNYLRVKIARHMQRIGAVAIKNTVYVLPAADSSLEDFQWALREIRDGGGEANVF